MKLLNNQSGQFMDLPALIIFMPAGGAPIMKFVR